MSSVYGVTGQTVRGTPEELLAGARPAAGRSARGIAREGEEIGPGMIRPRQPDAEAGPDQQAAQDYRAMLHRSPERPRVRHAFQWMTRRVVTWRPDAMTETAWRAFAGRSLGRATVLDGRRRRVRMITSRGRVNDPPSSIWA